MSDTTVSDIIGFVAGTLTTIAFFPQVIQAWKTKSTKDISLVMFTVLSIGILLWFIYGIMINRLPVILANGVTLILTIIIVILKIKYK